MIDEESEIDRLDSLFDELFPICRSITGPGLRKSLDIISDHISLEIEGIPSGTQVFDWEVPPEWRIHDARLVGPDGETYADFQDTNLSVVNYSEPVDKHLSLDQLDNHLYTNKEVPEAIPYVTSYYDRTWGFCLPHEVYKELPDGKYHAYIDSEFVNGELNYGHTKLPGRSDQEVLLSSYLCHPSMANNELSGPLVMTSLYKRIKEWEDREFTYRFVLCPETIGSITYLSEYGSELEEKLVGGLVLTCLGGPNKSLNYKSSRQETSTIDKTVRNLDKHGNLDFEIRSFTPIRGSDERHYCSPGFNFPVGQMSRTMPGIHDAYDVYHTSGDDKEFLTIDSLVDSSEVIEELLRAFEYAGYYENQNPCGEPMLSKHSLYPTVNGPDRWAGSDTVVEKEFFDHVKMILNYSDGKHSTVEIAEKYGCSVCDLIPAIDRLNQANLLERV